MKIKYIISLSIVAFIGASCWGAAENAKKRAQRINDERPVELFAQQEAPGAFEEMPREIFDEHILKHMPAAKLMEMAFEHPGLYKRIKQIPQFRQLQQNMNRELGKRANNKQEVFYYTALFNYPGGIDVVDYLAPDVNINAQNDKGYTALIWAVLNKNLEMIKLLLAKGANINERDKAGATALIFAATNKNNLEVGKLLLAEGSDINAHDNEGETALMSAVQKNNLEMVELLLANEADINAQDSRGNTALNWAVQKNNREMAELLLAKRANINVRNRNNYTALIWAALNNNLEMVELLLANGADISVHAGDDTALSFAEFNLTSPKGPDYQNRAQTIIDLLTQR